MFYLFYFSIILFVVTIVLSILSIGRTRKNRVVINDLVELHDQFKSLAFSGPTSNSPKKISVLVVGDQKYDVYVPVNASLNDIQAAAKSDDRVINAINGRRIVKTIVRNSSVEIFPENVEEAYA